MNSFQEWAFGKCEWWHFWRPQSGLLGGLFFGALLFGWMAFV